MTPETYSNPKRYEDPGPLDATSWSFDLPMSSPLSLNHRTHHQVKAKQVRTVRDAAAMLSKMAKIPKLGRCRVTLVYEPRDNRRRDPLNLVATLKPVQDGIVDAGVVPDDTIEYLESPMPIIDAPNGKKGRLWVLVEKLA